MSIKHETKTQKWNMQSRIFFGANSEISILEDLCCILILWLQKEKKNTIFILFLFWILLILMLIHVIKKEKWQLQS